MARNNVCKTKKGKNLTMKKKPGPKKGSKNARKPGRPVVKKK